MIHVSCNLCGRDDWHVRYPATQENDGPLEASVFRCTSPHYGSHAQIVECNHCGLVYANPRWTAEELVAAYEAVEDETYVAERGGRELTFQRHLEALERYTGAPQGRSLLDVGAYIGVFVEVATRAGWDAKGIEPSAWGVAQAQQRGLRVLQGTQEAPALAGQQFDVLTMWDVIEHVADPLAELEQARRLLKPGGWLAVHTMDVDSVAARVLGPRWPWLMDMHLTYFSKRTLADMLRKAGFEVVWVGTQGRFLRLGYLVSRLSAFNALSGKLATMVVKRLGLESMALPVNFGDLFTVYARRPHSW